jgi:hypothetical protein
MRLKWPLLAFAFTGAPLFLAYSELSPPPPVDRLEEVHDFLFLSCAGLLAGHDVTP